MQVYQCPECGLHYSDEDMAKQCEAWCHEHKSCSLNITKHSIEAQQGKKGGSDAPLAPDTSTPSTSS